MDTTITAAYMATMSLLAVYGLHRVALLWRFRWRAGERVTAADPGRLRRLTVQLPVYNERTVAARLVQAAGALEYPRELLEIQVLDDSSDETAAIVDRECELLRERGVEAQVIRRGDRRGFKAGALAYGLARSKGELVCIFDADFVPPSRFLLDLVGVFEDPAVGMVQARWDHSNRDESVLTRAESALLDGHFVIEHKVRHDSGLFFNFNGTAGIWRRSTIESAGGWQHDTLTEDLDLSYRAQLGGWKFVYAPMVLAPAEVPPGIAAFKSQQHRWAKGSVQVFRKLGWRILTSDEPWRIKLEALAHLTGNVGYPCVLLLAILLPLSLTLPRVFPDWVHVSVFTLCTLSVILFYESSQRAVGRSLSRRARDIVAAVGLGIGMCVAQTRAVVEGLLPGTGVFVRTPKQGDAPRTKRYAVSFIGWPGIELAFAAWFAWGLATALSQRAWGVLPFLLLFFASFAWVGTMSVRDWIKSS